MIALTMDASAVDTLFASIVPAHGRRQTLQVWPSQPIETTPLWRITGTSRRPLESLSISSMSAALCFTFR